MSEYDRLHRGETFKLSDFSRYRASYLNLINDLRAEKVTGQHTLPFEGEEQELILNVVHPIKPSPHEQYLQKRVEALTLINGGGHLV